MDHRTPLITLITPSYNRTELIEETCQSILHQTYPNWEWLIVDDHSADDSWEILQGLIRKDNRIKSIRRDRLPKGAPTCRNIGLENARGNYLIFLDSDDLLAPFCLEQRRKVMQDNSGLDFAVFPMLIFSDDPARAEKLWNIATPDPDIQRFLQLDSPWQTTGPIWKKQAVERIGGFTEGLACWQDVDFHLKALEAVLVYEKYYELPPDSYYRRHEQESISQRSINTDAKLKSRVTFFYTHYEVLKQTDHAKVLPALLIHVAISAIKVRNTRYISQLLFFGIKRSLISMWQCGSLLILLLIQYLRLYKLKTFHILFVKLAQSFATNKHLGLHLQKKTFKK